MRENTDILILLTKLVIVLVEGFVPLYFGISAYIEYGSLYSAFVFYIASLGFCSVILLLTFGLSLMDD